MEMNTCRLKSYNGCFCSVTQSCLTLYDPMEYSTPGFPVCHYLPEFAQFHVHWVDDVIYPSLPLFPPSPPALSLSQHQGIFIWVSSSHQVAKVLGVSASTSVLPMNIQDWFPLTGLVGSPWHPRDSQESSPTPQIKSISSSGLSFLYGPTLTSIHDYWKNHSLDLVGKVMSLLLNSLLYEKIMLLFINE